MIAHNDQNALQMRDNPAAETHKSVAVIIIKNPFHIFACYWNTKKPPTRGSAAFEVSQSAKLPRILNCKKHQLPRGMAAGIVIICVIT